MTKKPTWQQRNRAAFNAAWRRWYEQNAARKMAWQARRRDEIRDWFRELKARLACEACGENAPECLHFHHIDPDMKSFNVGLGAGSGRSRRALLAELAKCRVLCANCHLKLHWEERRKESG